MAADLIALPDSGLALTPLPTDRVRVYLENARARSTITGYRSSFHQFSNWCDGADLVALPATPETVALYVSSQAGRLKPTTLEHHLAAISKAHKAGGFASPIQDNLLVAETLKGIKRIYGICCSPEDPSSRRRSPCHASPARR